MWDSRFTRAHHVELPFVSAGMGMIAGPELAAAVSNAGGLGQIGVAPAPPPQMAAMIRDARARTSRNFGVNLIVESGESGPTTTAEHIDVCIALGVRVVAFHWHLPPTDWIERLHAAGAAVWMQVGSIAAARAAVQAGCDALIAQGSEAGGHNRSTIGLAALVPAVIEAVTPRFVIAAGGIADGRGVAAALALGADAVSIGTRLVASDEAKAHAEYKRRIVAATVDDVARTSIFGPEWPDQPMKVIRNRVVREWEGRDACTPRETHSAPIGHTRFLGVEYAMPRFSAVLPTEEASGDFEEMCLAAGESAGLVHDVRPAGAIVRSMMEEAARIMIRLPRRSEAVSPAEEGPS